MKTLFSVLYFSILLLINISLLNAQSKNSFNCATTNLHNDLLSKNKEYGKAHQHLDDKLYDWINNNTPNRSLSDYTLPVVVHIIHNNGSENISDVQVNTAIQHLNDAFANTGYYDPSTGVNTQISFCLAQRTPEGIATTGINRVQSSLTTFNYNQDDQTVKDLSRWNPLQYINVWVVGEICSNNGCGVAGYAYFPSAHGANYDGIVLEANYMGSSPASSSVLVHEMGHYLGLYHTFEGGCTNNNCQLNGDRVCDTPPDNTTARPACDTDMNSCMTDENDMSNNNPYRSIALGGLGDQVDMKENYMDYSRLECYDRFTQGQTSRMHGAIENVRYSLLDSPACIDPCPIVYTTDFLASADSIPVGAMISFTNTSIGADNYEWLINGILFSTSTDFSYTFNDEGSYTITLSTFSDISNCLPKDTAITIQVYCPVDAAFSASDETVLAGAIVDFTNTSSDASSYTWLVNGAIVSSDINFSLSTTEAGSYNVCLRAGNGFCESVTCQFITATSPQQDCGDAYYFSLGNEGVPDIGECILPASDGGYYIGGGSNGSSLLIKMNANNQIEWQKTFSNSDGDEWIFSLTEDGAYVLGTVWINNSSHHYCFKYDTNTHDFVWIRTITNSDHVRTYDIINVENSPNYTISGYMREAGPQGCDLILGYINKTTGDLVDLSKYTLGSCETGNQAILLNDKIYITGRYNAAGGGLAAFRPAITQLELDGTENWTRLYLINTNIPARLYATDIIEDSDHLVVCGQGDPDGTSTSNITAHIFKTDLNGAIQWASILDVQGGDTEQLTNIVKQADGYMAIGYYTMFSTNTRTLLLLKFTFDGDLMWTKRINDGYNYQTHTKCATLYNGNALITGTRTIGAERDIFLISVSPDGDLENNCVQLEDVEVEFSQLANPFDGNFSLSRSPYNPNDFPSQATASDANLPIDTLCYAPCPEVCENGLDDDGDGLIDCDDDDCPCFVDCGNTFIQAIGLPQINESLSTILLASDGFLYAAGNRQDQALLIKMNTEGVVISEQQFDLTNRQDRILSIIEDNNQNIIGVGFGQGNSGSQRTGFIFQYDILMESMTWVNNFSSITGFWGVNINPMNGNYLAAGASNNVDQNAVIAEFDQNTGTLNWTNSIDAGNSDAYYDVIPVGNTLFLPNRYTLFTSTDDMRAGITALDLQGSHQWSKYYLKTTSQSARQYSFAMVQDNDGLTVGYSGNPNGTALGGFKSGILRTDYAGNLQWATEYDVAGLGGELTYGMTTTPDGYLLYGYGISGDEDLMIIKTDKEGNALWARTYGGIQDDDFIFNASNQLFQANGFIYIVGRTRYYDTTDDALLIKANASDGSVNNDDCIYTELLDVNTTFFQNPYENNQSVSQSNFTNVINQVDSPQANLVNLNYTVLCQGSNIDLIAVIDSAFCNGDSLTMSLQICNNGIDTLLPGAHYTIYDGNPFGNTGVSVLSTQIIPSMILSGDCYAATLSLPYPINDIYLIANDDGSTPTPIDLDTDFPITTILECDYTNNVDSASIDIPILSIDLGPDTSVCENGIFLLDAGAGFISYLWQDGSTEQTYTAFETGTYSVEATTICGDVVSDTINISLVAEIIISLPNDTSICSGESISLSTPFDNTYTYQWSPAQSLSCINCPSVTATPTSSTTYEVAVSNQEGCVSVDSVTIVVENCVSVIDTMICNSDSLNIEGQIVYPNTVDTLDLLDGSTLVLNVIGIDTFFMAVDLGICLGDSVAYEGTVLYPGDSEQFLYTSTNGCDSIVEVTALALDTFFTVIDTTACLGSSVSYNGSTISPGESANFTFTAENGCDSTVQINVAPLDTFYLAIDLGVCLGDSVAYEGIVLYPGDTEQFLYTSTNGCDSIVEVTALALDTFFTVIDTTACLGSSVSYNGSTISPGESANFTFTAENGCDSTVQINVAPLDTFYLAIDLGVCLGDSVAYEGIVLYPGDTEQFLYTSTNGCDSIVEVTALALDTFFTVIDTTACLGSSVSYNGSTISPGESANFTFTAENGCDSTVQINVAPLDTFYMVIDLGICLGDSVAYEGIVLYPGDTEQFLYTSTNGCDSIVEVTALALDTFFTTIDTTACLGSSVSYNGSTISPGESASFTFTAENGCDSTVLVNVAPLDTFFTIIDTAICLGSTIMYNGSTISTGESAYFSFTAQNGCDSAVQVNVAALDTFFTTLEVSTCYDTPYLYEGVELAPNSVNPFNYVAGNGCDSTVIVVVSEFDDIQTYETLQACEGQSVDIFGQPTFETGLYSETYGSYQGCDSTHNIYFIVIDTAELNIPDGGLSCTYFSGELNVEITGGTAPYQIYWSDGQTGETATDLLVGDYYVTVIDAFGCQSIGVGTVYDTIPDPTIGIGGFSVTCPDGKDGLIIIEEEINTTPPYQYSIDDQSYQASSKFDNLDAGDYVLYVKDGNGCKYTFPIVIEEPTPIELSLPNDTTIQYGQSIWIKPFFQSDRSVSFEWSPSRWLDCDNCLDVMASPEQTTAYSIMVKDTNNCIVERSINIFVDKRVKIYAPNAFSPNGDGRNDYFTIFSGDNVEKINKLMVFDRWGGQVFQRSNFSPNRLELGWDGTINREPSPAGVYAYFAEVLLTNGETILLEGAVHLVR